MKKDNIPNSAEIFIENRTYRKRGLDPKKGRALDEDLEAYKNKVKGIEADKPKDANSTKDLLGKFAIVSKDEVNAKSKQKKAYADAKSEFMYIMQVALWKEDKSKKFIPTEYNVKVIKDLLQYFIKDRDGRLKVQKGIYLFGPKGSGKDFLMHCFSIFLETILKTVPYQMMPTHSVHQNVKGGIHKLPFYYKGNYCYRNLGYEPKFLYKPEDDGVMKSILIELNENPRNHRYKMATGNYLPDDLDFPYDDYIKDLIKRNYNLVFLDGPNLG